MYGKEKKMPKMQWGNKIKIKSGKIKNKNFDF